MQNFVSRDLAREHARKRFSSWWLAATFGVFGLTLLGCGSSQEDLMMRAARRSRPPDNSQKEELKDKPQGVATKKPEGAKKPKVNKVAALVPDRESEVNREKTDTAPDDVSQKEEEIALLPIEQRKPGTPLGGDAGRARAVQNLEAISKALLKYHEEKGLFPRTYSMTSTGIPTLSWRVELLPYLGYEALYKKFDWTVPWNREPNLSLLELIPNEYVSPERFDTKTNYLLPAYRSFMFGDNKARAQHNLEDGFENTIMLVEVDDRLAVPWTKPQDYVPGSLKDFSKDLGNLRGDGAFAVWANGWTTLLAKELTGKQVLDAFTYETGDGQKAGAIHRDISVGNVSEASVASVEPAKTPAKDESSPRPRTKPKQMVPARVRTPVPKAIDVAASKDRLRSLYADKMKEATSDSKKTKLASEMLKQALAMESDHAGAYALQSAAMRLAVEGGSPATLIEAIDQRVGTFDVDAYDENIAWLTAFGQGNSGRDPESVKGDELLRRCVRVMYAGIEDNDFVRASNAARLAYRFNGHERRDTIPKLLNRIRVLLGTSQREYDTAVKHLKAYRDDPTDVEAGAAFGRFLCFIKGDWENGLPLLAKGGSDVLQSMASLDLKGPETNEETLAIGDAWWELSQRARGGVYRQAARDRAIHWYSQIYELLPESLDKMHVKSRMDEAEEADGTSPIALCIQLADEVGVDLEYGLAAVADVGQTKRGRKNQGGRDEYD